MTRVQLAAVVLATVIGTLVVLLGQDIRSWRNTIDGDALAYATAPSQPVRLNAPTALPSRVSQALLSVGPDRQWLHALNQFVVAYDTTENLDALGINDLTLLNDGESALAKVAQDSNGARASQAYNLLAVLVFREAYPGTGVDAGLVGTALLDLQDAVRLDPSDEVAKENLELAMRVATAERALVQKGAGIGNRATRKHTGGFGAPPGVGY